MTSIALPPSVNPHSGSHPQLSEREVAQLRDVFAFPERVEIRSSDRRWRSAVLAAIMVSAAVGFCVAEGRSHAEVGTASEFSAEPLRSMAGAEGEINTAAPDLPVNDAGARQLARRDGVNEIAATAVTVKPTVYPFAFKGDMDVAEVHDRVVQFVFSKPLAEPAEWAQWQGGYLGVQNFLEEDAPRSQTPTAWNYVTKAGDGNATACVVMVSDQHAGAIEGLARQSGLDMDVARDFAVMHESVHCAQTGEKLAAIFDLSRHGHVRADRIAGGMLGANMERLLATGQTHAVVANGFLDEPREQLSAERYADGFAMVALLVQGRLNRQQANGLVAWRLGDDAKHSTGSFLTSLLDTLTRDPAVLASMRSKGEPGFDANKIAAFVRPRWHGFELAELNAAMAARPLASAMAGRAVATAHRLPVFTRQLGGESITPGEKQSLQTLAALNVSAPASAPGRPGRDAASLHPVDPRDALHRGDAGT